MRHLLALAAMITGIATLTTGGSAAPYAGTQCAGTITTTIDTGTATVGQPVTLTNVRSESGDMTGATMYGTITRVVRAGQGRPAQVQMTFNRLRLPNGTTYAINGVVTGMQTNTKNNAAKEAGGAVAGMLVGNMLLKTIFHASGGGLLGAAGGYLIAKNNRQNMTIPAGSVVRVELRSVRRQASH